MKEVVDFLHKKGYIFKKFDKIDNNILNTRKRLDIYKGVDLASFYVAVFYTKSKSRFIMKNAYDIEDLLDKLAKLSRHNYKKKILLISSQICSKSKKFLEDQGWKIYATV